MIDIERLAAWMDEQGLGVGEPVESRLRVRGDPERDLRDPPG